MSQVKLNGQVYTAFENNFSRNWYIVRGGRSSCPVVARDIESRSASGAVKKWQESDEFARLVFEGILQSTGFEWIKCDDPHWFDGQVYIQWDGKVWFSYIGDTRFEMVSGSSEEEIRKWVEVLREATSKYDPFAKN